jgi:hypothetical protein
MRGLEIARVHLFFSLEVGDELFLCVLIHKFCKSFNNPNPKDGMWIIEPNTGHNKSQVMQSYMWIQ